MHLIDNHLPDLPSLIHVSHWQIKHKKNPNKPTKITNHLLVESLGTQKYQKSSKNIQSSPGLEIFTHIHLINMAPKIGGTSIHPLTIIKSLFLSRWPFYMSMGVPIFISSDQNSEPKTIQKPARLTHRIPIEFPPNPSENLNQTPSDACSALCAACWRSSSTASVPDAAAAWGGQGRWGVHQQKLGGSMGIIPSSWGFQ